MNVAPRFRPRYAKRAFSLVELLVGMAIFMVIIVLLLAAINQTSSTLQNAKNQTGSYQSARFAFSLITRTLSQATLNTYYDYFDASGNRRPSKADGIQTFVPHTYGRHSDLHFVIEGPQGADFNQGNSIFFQAKLGKTEDAGLKGRDSLLNAVGYYVTYGKDSNLPTFLQGLDRNRFRLMQYLKPSEDLDVFTPSGKGWFTSDVSSRSKIIAENIILALFWPRVSQKEEADGTSLTENYTYDSRLGAGLSPQPVTANQQPPLVTVTLVAIDGSVADRLPDTDAPPSEITSCLTGLFDYSDPDSYADDLAELDTRLNEAQIGYRIFTDTVPIRESKWTK
jgi:uncharacterized protein (TIGR02599 family)